MRRPTRLHLKAHASSERDDAQARHVNHLGVSLHLEPSRLPKSGGSVGSLCASSRADILMIGAFITLSCVLAAGRGSQKSLALFEYGVLSLFILVGIMLL